MEAVVTAGRTGVVDHKATRLWRRVDEATSHVAPVIAHYVEARAARASRAGAHAVDLWHGLGEQIGGKLGRPRLTLAAYFGCGGDNIDDIVPVAAAQEILHTAMLIHDDLLDGDEARRGKPNLAGRYRDLARSHDYSGDDAEDVVRAGALLGGDLAIAAAMDIVLGSTLDPTTQTRVLAALVDAIQTTVAGELLDVLAQGRRTIAAPERIGAFKTAHYTCQTPLVAGAFVADAPQRTVESLRECGWWLGIAFQTADDYLGVFGRPEATGKSVLSDLSRGKWTILLATAWERADADQARTLTTHIGRRDMTPQQAHQIRDLFVAVGAEAATRERVAHYLQQARAALRDDVPSELAHYLSGVADEIEESMR